VNYEQHHPRIHIHKVQTAQEMYAACEGLFGRADIAVMSAAVADYRPMEAAPEKIKKKEETLTLELVKTKDILASLGAGKRQGQVLAGFALETSQERKNALEKMEKKNADLMVLNSLNDEGAGFGFDTNKITIFGRGGEEWAYERKTKPEVAKDIVDRIVKLL
jgi:phosphopantothenoylcysteine decarboxylase/phosphopantothenate--cysteine ligase